jgi:hypothetical protein
VGKNDLQNEIDSLFRLPLAEFIAARKELSARLKKQGSANDSERVKLLAKPSVSAWTVNQLYWQQRDDFDALLGTGQRFRKAQSSGKVAEMRAALGARSEAISRLENLATSLLHDAGHNPTPDMIRRITTTLEAVSSFDVLPDGSSPGRMTKDVDPPGFETLLSFVPAPQTTKRAEPARAKESPPTKTKTSSAAKENRQAETRRVELAQAKVSLAHAKKALVDARAKTQTLEVTQKKLDAVAKQAEKQRREAEERFRKAGAAADEAAEDSHNARTETDKATKALEDAKRAVEKATKELESLFRGE